MSDGTEELQELHVQCVRALKAYMAEANKTCKLLTRITEFPLSFKERSEVLSQRLVENAAQESYQNARQKLFQTAGWEG
jgi:hypothetical protein